jgi:flagellar L-ring protein precursor FlgH
MNNRVLLGAALAFALVMPPASGRSLFEEASYRPLAGDNKAFRVGDVLTVQISENSSASTSADTGTRRRNQVAAEIDRTSGRAVGGRLSVNGDFDGGGRTERSNRVLITLGVTVREVLANGDLRVAGDQMLAVNGEQQRVALEGRVRPADVSDGNVVLSTRLADARITYVGEGDLSQRQERAWWRKVLDWVGM